MGSGGTKIEKLDKKGGVKKNSQQPCAENKSKDRIFSSLKLRNAKVNKVETWATKPPRKKSLVGNSTNRNVAEEDSSSRSEFSHLLHRLKNGDPDYKEKEKEENNDAHNSDLTLERYSPELQCQNLNNSNDKEIEYGKVNYCSPVQTYEMGEDRVLASTGCDHSIFTSAPARNAKLGNPTQRPLPAPRLSLLTNRGQSKFSKAKSSAVNFFNKPCYTPPQFDIRPTKVGDGIIEHAKVMHCNAKENMLTEEELEEIENLASEPKLQKKDGNCIKYSEEELELMKNIEMDYFKLK